jgi:hypothetical protein
MPMVNHSLNSHLSLLKLLFAEYLYSKHPLFARLINCCYKVGHGLKTRGDRQHNRATNDFDCCGRRGPTKVAPAPDDTKRAQAKTHHVTHKNHGQVPGEVPTSCLVNVESGDFVATSRVPASAEELELRKLELAALRQLYDALHPADADRSLGGSVDGDDYDLYINEVYNNASLVRFSCTEHNLMDFFVSTTQSARRKYSADLWISNRSGNGSDPDSRNLTPNLNNLGMIVEDTSNDRKRTANQPTGGTNEETPLVSSGAPTSSTTQERSSIGSKSRVTYSESNCALYSLDEINSSTHCNPGDDIPQPNEI